MNRGNTADTQTAHTAERFDRVVARMQQLREFSGSSRVFWQSYLSLLAEVSDARLAVLMQEGPKDSPGWKKAVVWPVDGLGESAGSQFLASAGDLAEACVQQGGLCRSRAFMAEGLGECRFAALSLDTDQPSEKWVAAFLLVGRGENEAEEAIRRLRLSSHLPAVHRLKETASRSEIALSHLASVLDLTAVLNGQQRFLALAMTLCNELASRHHCDRVSLGWLEGEYIRVQAISHSEKFEKKMEAVKQLEAAMEEALDQDEIVVWPEVEDQQLVTRDHQRFAEEQRVPYVCSLPLRIDGEVLGVITCERATQPFVEVELRLVALCGDMAIRRLQDLKRTDRWWGARMLEASKERAGKLLGPEHTGAKLLGLLAFIGLLVLVFGGKTYRIDAPFSVRTRDAAYLSAPFKGYIAEVNADLGQTVAAGAPLLALDTRELLLAEAEAAADEMRYQREAEKAEAAGELAEMGIAQAQAAQARAKLQLVRFNLRQASVNAPFDGAIVEGDLRKRIGAPVNEGDILFKVARTANMYIECDVNERDLDEIREGGRGEIAFASLPGRKFPVRVEHIDPVAHTKEAANVFVVRCAVEAPVETWWRPGMSGTAKLNGEYRSFFWIVTHRTVEFLRMTFWI